MLTTGRLHDFLPRVADGQPQPRWQQLHVPVGVPRILQHAVGVSSGVRHLGQLRRRYGRVPRAWCQGQENLGLRTWKAYHSGWRKRGVCESLAPRRKYLPLSLVQFQASDTRAKAKVLICHLFSLQPSSRARVQARLHSNDDFIRT
jgi:hypothetical protein